ncbi:MAG: class II fructose-bisphosphate aldolase, partial [Mycolicibacterium sp.]|nr:class II fructose-bisphosphate aldolase [Mycolicibacterium sp.]
MSLARTADLVAEAQRAGTGVAAFNVITLEHAEAIVDGAALAGRAVILQISENAVKFHRGQLRPIVAAAAAVAAEAPIPASIHLDHVEDVRLLHASADTPVSSAMFDAAALEYDANVEATRSAADWAHA